MSEIDYIICKRDSEFEGSSIKRIRLDDDDSVDSEVLRSPILSPLASHSGGFSTVLSEEEDRRRSSFNSGCSSSETNKIDTDTRLPFLDLEAKQISETETEISTLITNNYRKQGNLSSEILGETAEMDSTTMTTTTTERRDRHKPEKTEKSPTQAELEDFFSAAERSQQKRFRDKYNYDFVNDTPLEGRYEWINKKKR